MPSRAHSLCPGTEDTSVSSFWQTSTSTWQWVSVASHHACPAHSMRPANPINWWGKRHGQTALASSTSYTDEKNKQTQNGVGLCCSCTSDHKSKWTSCPLTLPHSPSPTTSPAPAIYLTHLHARLLADPYDSPLHTQMMRVASWLASTPRHKSPGMPLTLVCPALMRRFLPILLAHHGQGQTSLTSLTLGGQASERAWFGRNGLMRRHGRQMKCRSS